MSGQCKEDGRCECRPGFVGARCDMCEENYFYNRSVPGCQQCPSCYSLVRDKVSPTPRQRLRSPRTEELTFLSARPGEPAEAEASRTADADR